VSTPTLAERVMDGTDARNAKLKTIAGLRKTIQQAKKGISQRERKLRRLENSLLPNSLDVKPEPISFDRITSKKEVEAIKVIASRMREARRLCGHTVRQAAQLLNVAPEDLKAIENTAGIYHVPLWLIKRAAETYCVPIDFLFGIIEDFDAADGEAFLSRNFLAALQRQQLEDFTKSAASQMQQNLRLTALNSGVAAAVMAVQHISDAFNQFRHLNPVKFLDMPGGARLVRQVEIAEDLVAHATCVLTHYKALPESLRAHADYMLETFPIQNGYFSD
jgi:DNA-binding XRE family transcriptional regulator